MFEGTTVSRVRLFLVLKSTTVSRVLVVNEKSE